MNLIKRIIFFTTLISFSSQAGLPPTTAKSSADATDVTTFLFRFPNFTGSHTGTVFSLGINSIAGGGTGASTKASAFDALSPMTTQYDFIIGGASGTGVRLPKGADNTHLTTQSGVVAWTSDPTPYVISSVSTTTSAACGTTYIANTSGAAFTITLPSPVSGCYVGIVDATGTFDVNNLTLAPNGGEKIMYLAASKVLQTFGFSHVFFSNGTDWFMQ